MALPQLGDMVGPYRILGQLGQGGMATVYKAYHPSLDREVALKMMHQAFLEDKTFHARFAREAQIVARLTHPHIIPVYDYAEHEGQPYLVMKFVQGKTLKGTLADGSLTLQQVLHVMTAVADALTYAHQQGVLHRDIKPSNIVIDKDNTPYLTDFGLARIAESGESTLSTDMVLGTPHYMSPEQALGRKSLDARTDIYSLGIVLYELIVGRVPFSADTPYAVIHDHIYSPLPLPSQVNTEIPPRVEQVLLKALAKEPAERYASAVEMIDAFKKAVSESKLDTLHPDRASIASISLSKLRDGATQPISSIPPVTKPTVPLSGLRSLESIARERKRGRRWMFGGLLMFVLTCGLSFLLMGSALNRLDGLAEPSFDTDGDESLGFDISLVEQLSLEEAQARVDADPVSTNYLILARAQWAAGDEAAARSSVSTGLPLADNVLEYEWLAAELAVEAGDDSAAVILYIAAINHSSDLPLGMGMILRDVGGHYIYTTLSRPGMTLDLSDRGLSEAYGGVRNTDYGRIFIAYSLLLRNRDGLARTTLARVPDDTMFRAERLLITGELLAGQGDTEGARHLWQQIQRGLDTPEWVRERADELLNQEG